MPLYQGRNLFAKYFSSQFIHVQDSPVFDMDYVSDGVFEEILTSVLEERFPETESLTKHVADENILANTRVDHGQVGQVMTLFTTRVGTLAADKHVIAKLPLVPFVIINLTRLTAGVYMIECTYPGSDRLLRVVDVRIGDKVFRRPITRISPLETTTELSTLIEYHCMEHYLFIFSFCFVCEF